MSAQLSAETILKALGAKVKPRALAQYLVASVPPMNRRQKIKRLLTLAQDRADQQDGVYRVLAYTAASLSPATIQMITKKLHTQTQKRVVVQEIIRPTLKGGVILSHRGERVDNCIKTKLQKLEVALWQN